jgi:hypothetical protein
MTISVKRIVQLSAAAIVMSALAYGGVSAAEKKKDAAPKAPAACRTIMSEAECTPREDCTWRDAVKKGDKITRRASCAAKPKTKAKKKTT